MEKSKHRASRNLARNARGSEIAEFAMILPLLFLFLIGIFWFGQAFLIYGTITNAARDGARAAVNPSCATCTGVDPSANAWNIIQSDLQAAHVNPILLQQPTTPPSLCACVLNGSASGCTSATVSCDSEENNICVQGVTHSGSSITEGLVQLSSSAAGGSLPAGAGECGVSISFQYPYTFWLPFTTLDKRTVNLRAQAQMRAERQ